MPSAPSSTSTSSVSSPVLRCAATVTGKCDKLSSATGRNVTPFATNSAVPTTSPGGKFSYTSRVSNISPIPAMARNSLKPR
ncbi:Uncharacterised protein [Mycobacterium tuberculosis]|uniref:Uncharacterized protein n=1 Tax=Mycobacterium tuberculosis TaxID=1773 RepID=A0A916L8I6_MYCTX|nr:Uncharacterised protein [Mycobacterium tuberculosis]COX09891.1 Uncharacterised protein [Mycobacterium tuberculosis]COX92473.1 Uncharacterised protein [Mycobacterium tuberculosis]CPB36708.1 Uncharacterised protein [Mycobacterium tuberculosis]